MAEGAGKGAVQWLQTLMTAVVCIVLLFSLGGGGGGGAPLPPSPRGGAVVGMGYEPRAGDIVIASKTTAEPLEGRPSSSGRGSGGADGGAGLRGGAGYWWTDRPWRSPPTFWSPWPLPQKPEMQGTRFQVEADSLFLLGDNRNGSTDSRHSGVGSVHRDCLLGRAVAVIWPWTASGCCDGNFLAIPAGSRYNKRPINTVRSARRSGRSCQCRKNLRPGPERPTVPSGGGGGAGEAAPGGAVLLAPDPGNCHRVHRTGVHLPGGITRVVGHSMDDTLADGGCWRCGPWAMSRSRGTSWC